MSHLMQNHLGKLLLVTLFTWTGLSEVSAQCDGTVPNLVVDLSSSPTATYLSPPVIRNGYCCGVSGNDRCLRFEITLHPNAQGINFQVCAGAVPGGSMFYQINCGPPQAVGTPICLDGVGPHILTFCKPGNNDNQYCITSIPDPAAGPPISVSEGCIGNLTSSGFAPGTVQWTSIFPGTAGQYNNYLSCPTCENTGVTGQAGYPAFVDYQVCGLALSPCSNMPFCDTVRVNFYSTLAVSIVPTTPTVCFGSAGTTITAVGSGGLPPYSFTWNNGATTAGIFVGPGTYTVSMSDATNCPPTTATVTVTQFLQPIQAFAGSDILVCGTVGPVQLSGSVTGVSTGIWSGGAGQYQPTNTALNATYVPTQNEINAGFVDLMLSTTNNGTCPGAQDIVRITFDPGILNASVAVTNATCNGTSNGSATFSPALPGTTFSWTPSGQTGATAAGLGAGNYSVTATNAAGCSLTLPVTIGQPAALAIASIDVVNETCVGSGNGSVTVNITGGTMPYTYIWNVPGSGNSVTGTTGVYTVGVTDANGCAAVQGSGTIQADAQPNAANAGADLVGCNGAAVPLQGTVTNATGGIWSGGNGSFTGNGLNVQYQPTNAEILNGSVVLTLTTTGNTNCAAATDQVTVLLSNSYVNASLTSTDVTCNGGSNGTATFSPVQPGMQFAWQGIPGQTNALATGLSAGNVVLMMTDILGCSYQYNTIIDQPEALQVASITATNESCAGAGDGSVSVQVTGGTAPYSYAWNVPGNGPVISGTTGEYTVMITDANGCAPIQANASIAANGQPNIANAGADFSACMGEFPVQLSGSVLNATGGTWSGGSGQFTGNGIDAQYTPTMAEIQAGSVVLTLTTIGNTSCPAASDQVTLSLSNLFLNADLLATNVNCAGGSNGTLLFTPSVPGSSYDWPAFPTQTGPLVTGVGAGQYSVEVTDQYGCSETFNATITQPNALVVNAMNTIDASCFGFSDGAASVMMSGGVPPYTYQWSSGGNAASIADRPAGIHTVSIVDANGCSMQVPLQIGQPAPLTFSAYVPDTVCVNVPVAMNAVVNGGTAPYSVQWIGIGSGPSITHSFDESQTVQVNVTDANGCPSQMAELPVYVLDLTAASLETYGDTIVCPGGYTYVGATLENYPGTYQMVWPASGNTGGGPFMQPITSNMNLNVIVMDQCANTLIGTVQLGLETPPTIVLPSMLGQGCAPLTVQMPDDLTDDPVTYAWNFGNGSTSDQQAPTVVFNTPGSYNVSLTVTTPIGCTASAETTGQVIALAPPQISIQADPWITDIDHNEIDFTAQSISSLNFYAWSFGDGAGTNAINPTHTYAEPGSYHVMLTVQDLNGCTNTAEGLVQINPVYDIVVPNIFTPDLGGGSSGEYHPLDLSNDVFYPFVRYVDEFRMRIFNRWGELIFESNDLARGWDGYYRDQLSPQDVYVYQLWVRFIDGVEKNQIGDVTLMR